MGEYHNATNPITSGAVNVTNIGTQISDQIFHSDDLPRSVAPELNGAFANADHVEVSNVTTPIDAVVLNGSASVDAYSLAPSFTGGDFSIEEAVAILGAANSASVISDAGFTLNIVDDAAAIKTAISGAGDALAALQNADHEGVRCNRR